MADVEPDAAAVNEWEWATVSVRFAECHAALLRLRWGSKAGPVAWQPTEIAQDMSWGRGLHRNQVARSQPESECVRRGREREGNSLLQNIEFHASGWTSFIKVSIEWACSHEEEVVKVAGEPGEVGRRQGWGGEKPSGVIGWGERMLRTWNECVVVQNSTWNNCRGGVRVLGRGRNWFESVFNYKLQSSQSWLEMFARSFFFAISVCSSLTLWWDGTL